MIPKKIHFCWFGNNDFPPIVKKCMDSWRVHMPEWEIILWNEENSFLNHPFVQKALHEKKYAFVADYVRFHVLYNYGGVYLDTDVEVVKDFTPLLSNGFFASYEDTSNKYIGTAVLGSEKNNIYIKDVLKYYDDLNTYETSPSILSKVYNEKKFEGIELYSYSFFYPYNPYDKTQEVKQLFFSDIVNNTFAIHHWNYSWRMSILERLINKIRKWFN